MAEHAAVRDTNRCPTHPGALLREDTIPATGRPKAEIARLLGVSLTPVRCRRSSGTRS